MRKNYKYLPEIDKIIQYAFEAGLIDKFERDSRYHRHYIKTDERDIILSIALIGGALLSLAIGISLATMTAIAELVTARKIKAGNRHWIWLFANKCFDGRRLFNLDKSHANDNRDSSEMGATKTVKTAHKSDATGLRRRTRRLLKSVPAQFK